MFNTKLSTQDIKKIYRWQAVKKLGEKLEKADHEIIKDCIKEYGGHFAFLIYFNNENDMMKSIIIL